MNQPNNATRQRLVRSTLLMVCAIALISASCGGSDELVDQSTVAVLIPTNARFADSLEFSVADVPNNYVLRSNWSPEFDNDVDRESAVESYQITDVQAWESQPPEADEATTAALVAVISDAQSPDASGPCTTVDGDTGTVSCVYPVRDGESLTIIARYFPATSTTMVVLSPEPAALDFASGDFSAISAATAAETM